MKLKHESTKGDDGEEDDDDGEEDDEGPLFGPILDQDKKKEQVSARSHTFRFLTCKILTHFLLLMISLRKESQHFKKSNRKLKTKLLGFVFMLFVRFVSICIMVDESQ